MKLSRALLSGLALALVSTAALAQYSWIDKNGHKVYSDQPPPSDVPQKNVVSQPRGGRVVPVAAPAGPAASAASQPAAAASAPSGVDKALEEKKKQADAEAAAKKKAEEERLAAARAENCRRAMQAKATLDSGMRMARLNDKGEREILDDDQRAAETQRVQQVIDSDCK